MRPVIIQRGNTYKTASNRREAVKTTRGILMKKVGEEKEGEGVEEEEEEDKG